MSRQRAATLGDVERPNGESVVKDASAPYYWAAFQVIGDWK